METSGFEISAALRSMVANTWGRSKSLEHLSSQQLIARDGPVSRMTACRLPGDALRDMTAAGVSGSGYLVATNSDNYLPALQASSVVLTLGAQQINFPKNNIVLPKGSTGTATYWLQDENSPITEGQPTIGLVAATPKILAALTEISHQMLTQSNAEEVVRAELRRACASAIDAAALCGAGTLGSPLGILNVPGVGAFSGTTLNRAALTNAQADVSNANAIVSGKVGYVSTPDVANTLANRADTIESTSPVWKGPLHDGLMCGARALSTKNCPSSTAIYGDWANLSIVTWGSVELAADPFTKFNSGLVAIRLLLMVDAIATAAAGFSVAGSIT